MDASEFSGDSAFAAVLERIEGWFKVTADGYQQLNQRFDRLELEMHRRDEELDKKIDFFASRLIKRMDDRFDQVDKRFVHVDKRFEQVDKRFEQVDKRFEQVDKRFEQVDKRFEQVDKRFGQLEHRLERIDLRLGNLEGRFDVHEREHLA